MVMATWSMCFTIISILAKEHPNGLTLEELFQKSKLDNPTRFDCVEMLNFVLGIRDGSKQDYGMVRCWKEENNIIIYDTSRQCYAPSLESFGFTELFNEWLKNHELSHLILYKRLTPENSEQCPLGFDWSEIPHQGHCNWDYEKQECDPSCWISKKKLAVASILVEGRDYRDYYRKRNQLDGD